MNPHTTRRPTSSAGYPRALRDVKRAFGELYESAHIHHLVLAANLVCLAFHIHRRGGSIAHMSAGSVLCGSRQPLRMIAERERISV
jgi:hypothetical protein